MVAIAMLIANWDANQLHNILLKVKLIVILLTKSGKAKTLLTLLVATALKLYTR